MNLGVPTTAAAGRRESSVGQAREARPQRALVARLGGTVVAFPAGAGTRVVEVESCTRVPTGPAHLIGIGNARGAVLALIDVRPVLGFVAASWNWPLRALVVGAESLRAAFAVEEVLGLENLAALRPAPAAELAGGLATHGRGILELGTARAVVLDVESLIEALRLRRPAPVNQLPGHG